MRSQARSSAVTALAPRSSWPTKDGGAPHVRDTPSSSGRGAALARSWRLLSRYVSRRWNSHARCLLLPRSAGSLVDRGHVRRRERRRKNPVPRQPRLEALVPWKRREVAGSRPKLSSGTQCHVFAGAVSSTTCSPRRFTSHCQLPCTSCPSAATTRHPEPVGGR